MNAERAVRWTAAAALVAVALVAAYVSYWHAVEVVTRHAEPGIIGHLYPVLIDGIIVGASMAILDAAQHGRRAPWLAWAMLAAGIAVTLAANVSYGARAGWASALWAAWPAAAFVGTYETMMVLVRASAGRAADEAAGHVSSPLFTDAETAAGVALRATLAAGNPLSANQLSSRFNLTRPQATKLRTRVLAESNGHRPQETGGNGDVDDLRHAGGVRAQHGADPVRRGGQAARVTP